MRSITLLCTFTRHWAVEPWLDCLDGLEIDEENTEVVFVVDIDDDRITKPLHEFLAKHNYKTSHVIVNSEHEPSEIRINTRRDRIAEVLNQAKEFIGNTDFVFGLEDDTLFPPDALKKLLKIADKPKFGYAEGVQVGRWGTKMIGAWLADDLDEPHEFMTLLPPKIKKIQKIDAGGFYCFLTPTSLFKQVEHSWRDPLGPDAYYTMELGRMGYDRFIDWTLECGHHDHGIVLMPTRDDLQTAWYRLQNDKWEFSRE